ncbi:insulinase family protein [Sphingomonas colocasiae]|uniref:Insulinase family protein n=1 Tax=Sphingomonas colocasiae TaxID=1848973 RepID=A0ABS7PVZ1_9SPHN|nr:insulinase family protein [Sphingomonas colocasiae]
MVSTFTACFTKRLTERLRGQGWTYGVSCQAHMDRDLGFLQITTSVQADRTMDAIEAIEAEIVALSSAAPITQDEFASVHDAQVLGLVNMWTTNNEVLNSLLHEDAMGHPEGYAADLERRLCAITVDQVNEIAPMFGDPGKYVWVAAGDRKHLSAGRFVMVDRDGLPV